MRPRNNVYLFPAQKGTHKAINVFIQSELKD
ncbi:RepB family protein [Escherichia coli]